MARPVLLRVLANNTLNAAPNAVVFSKTGRLEAARLQIARRPPLLAAPNPTSS